MPFDSENTPACAANLSTASADCWQHQFAIASRLKINQYCEAKGIDPKCVVVEPFLSKFMREHQRQGVQFMFDCVTGIRPADGHGCILADDMVRYVCNIFKI